MRGTDEGLEEEFNIRLNEQGSQREASAVLQKRKEALRTRAVAERVEPPDDLAPQHGLRRRSVGAKDPDGGIQLRLAPQRQPWLWIAKATRTTSPFQQEISRPSDAQLWLEAAATTLPS